MSIPRPQPLATRSRVALVALVALLAGLGLGLACASSPDPTRSVRDPAMPYNVGPAGVAIGGYDPVAYFPEGGGAARLGSPEFALEYDGAIWHFASAKHRAHFENAPEAYRPQFGGWCAYAVADGKRVAVDPTSFLIQDGRLLLFYDSLLADTRTRWLRRPDELLARADARWEARTTRAKEPQAVPAAAPEVGD